MSVHAFSMSFGRHQPLRPRIGVGDDITGDTPLAGDYPTAEAIEACSPSGIKTYEKTSTGFKVICNDGKACERGAEGITACSKSTKAFTPLKPIKTALTPTTTPSCPEGEVWAPSIGKCIEKPSASSCAKRGMAFDVSKKVCVEAPKVRDATIGDADQCILQGLAWDPNTGKCVAPPQIAPGPKPSDEPAPEEEKGMSTGMKVLYGALGIAGVIGLYFVGKAALGEKSSPKPARSSNPARAGWIIKKRGKEYFGTDDKAQAFAVYYSARKKTPGSRIALYRHKGDREILVQS